MKIAVITGASSGIGREFARQIGHFYQTLEEIWVIARRKERIESLAAEVNVPVRVLDGDLLTKEFYDECQKLLNTENPDIRMLVNAAGFGKSGRAEDIYRRDKKSQLQMIDLNCIALTRMTFTCLSWMKKGSRIINLSSAAAFCPQPGFAVYAATKSYVLSFSRGLGAELKGRQVYVTAVCPGPVDTEFFEISGSADASLKEAVMVSAPEVVKKALLDSRAKREVSVYGTPMKGARLASKILPHSWVIKLETIGKRLR